MSADRSLAALSRLAGGARRRLDHWRRNRPADGATPSMPAGSAHNGDTHAQEGVDEHGGFFQRITLDFPVRPRPRFEPPGPPHRLLNERISARRAEYGGLLERFLPVMDAFAPVPVRHPSTPLEPYWANDYYSGRDAVSLYCMLALHNPTRLLEVGSGTSTKFSRKAVVEHSLGTRIVSLDPTPRAEVDDLCDEVVRQPAEDADPHLFEQLEAGDFLFIDGSHRCFTNSDVTVLFLEVLPELVPGVVVHVHDIFLPYDYPAAWNDRYYSEQYLLAAQLLADGGRTEVVLPNWFITQDDELQRILDPVWDRPDFAGVERHGVSFWFTTPG